MTMKMKMKSQREMRCDATRRDAMREMMIFDRGGVCRRGLKRGRERARARVDERRD